MFERLAPCPPVFESQTAGSLFAVYAPCRALADSVSGIWFARGRVDYQREVVLPNGAVELIFNLGPPQWVFGGGAHLERRYDVAWLAGIQRGPLVIGDQGKGCDLVGVRFQPGGLAPWLSAPMSELTDGVFETRELSWGFSSAALVERLAATRDLRARLALVERTLLATRQRATDHRVRLALSALQAAHAERSLGDLAAQLGTSHQTLIRLFHHQVGVSPRKLARILRFDHLVTALNRQPRAAWAALAATHGYADQAHLTREVRTFAGVSPRTLFATRTPHGMHLVDR